MPSLHEPQKVPGSLPTYPPPRLDIPGVVLYQLRAVSFLSGKINTIDTVDGSEILHHLDVQNPS